MTELLYTFFFRSMCRPRPVGGSSASAGWKAHEGPKHDGRWKPCRVKRPLQANGGQNKPISLMEVKASLEQ